MICDGLEEKLRRTKNWEETVLERNWVSIKLHQAVHRCVVYRILLFKKSGDQIP